MRISSVTIVFIMVKNPQDLAKFTLIYSIADLVGNLSLWLYLPKYLKGIKVKNINILKHIPQVVLLFVPQIANQIYKILDTTMIGNLVENKSEVGFYEQGQKVIRLLLTIVTSLGVVMIPRMASTFASGDKNKINEYMKNSFNFVFFLAFPIMFGIISIANDFVPIFFGTGYDKVVILIRIISPIIILMGVANVIGTQYLLPTKRQKEYTTSVTVGVIVNFILNYILISLYESIGASIATVLSQLIVDIIQIRYIKNEINFKELIKLSYKYIISSLIMFIACFFVKIFINLDFVTRNIQNLNTDVMYSKSIISISLQIIIGMIVYLGMLLLIYKDKYLKLYIDKIKEKVLKKKKTV